MWIYLAKVLTYNTLGLKKLYGQNSHDWKLIPMHFIKNAFGKALFFIQILVSKLLHSMRFLLLRHSSIMEQKLFSYLLHY